MYVYSLQNISTTTEANAQEQNDKLLWYCYQDFRTHCTRAPREGGSRQGKIRIESNRSQAIGHCRCYPSYCTTYSVHLQDPQACAKGPRFYCGSHQALVEHPKAPRRLGVFNLAQHLHWYLSCVPCVAELQLRGAQVRWKELCENVTLWNLPKREFVHGYGWLSTGGFLCVISNRLVLS